MNNAMAEIRACRNQLIDLVAYCRDRVKHLQALPTAVEQAVIYANQVASSPDSSGETKEMAAQISSSLRPFLTNSELPQSLIDPLIQTTLRLLADCRNLPDHATKGSLWNELHSTIQQHMESARVSDSDLRARLREISTCASALGISEDVNTRLQAAMNQLPKEFTSTALRTLTGLLEGVVKDIPEASQTVSAPLFHGVRTNRFQIVVVEDNPLWQQFVCDAIERVKSELGPAFSISTQCFTNVKDALAAVMPKKKETSTVFDQSESLQTIVITDMGLPETSEDAAAVLRGETTPDRANGHKLLAEIRSYRANIPCIILTTPPYLLSDQLEACRQGIEDYDYVLKGPDKEDRLVAAILRQLTRSQAHTTELWFPNTIRVDDIPAHLSEMPFRTFYALCQLSHRNRNVSFSLNSILDQLDETFRDKYDYKRPPETAVEHAQTLGRKRSGSWWSPEWDMQISNVIHLWAARKADSRGNLTSAIELLKRENFSTWKDSIQLFNLYRRANPSLFPDHDSDDAIEDYDPNIFASDFDRVFGGLEIDKRADYDLHNIEDHINQIRSTIHGVFKQVHQFIEPRRELLVSRQIDGEVGYRVLGHIVIHGDSFDEDEEQPAYDDDLFSKGERKLSVLVVENEPSYLERIKYLLETAGFDVLVATNEQDAISIASVYRPQIVSLDLHIPVNRTEYERDSQSGDREAGLRTLAVLRDMLPDVRVVIPTTLFNLDEARETAARLNVPVTNIVPKGQSSEGADWEGHFVLSVSRLREEIATQAILPALPPWLCPIIQVNPSSDFNTGRLNLTVNGKAFQTQKSKQGLLLAILIKRHDETVFYGEIDREVQGEPVAENTRKMWIKNLREKIRADWLGLSTKDARPELDILETVDDGLVLHAFVEGLEL